MPDWSTLTPTIPKPPRAVLEALGRCADIRDRLAAERDAAVAAELAVPDAQGAQREALARAFADGENAQEDHQAVDAAQAAYEAAQRRVEACELASVDLEARLRDQIEQAAAKWAETAVRDRAKAEDEARQALESLRGALRARVQAGSVAHWLTDPSGLQAGRPPRSGGLGTSPASRSSTANNQAVPLETLLEWLASAIDPPPSEPQAEHAIGAWPRMGAVA